MKKLSIQFRKIHKWFALVVGLQLFIWTVSGFYMSVIPIENIRSEHLLKNSTAKTLNLANGLVPVQKILSMFPKREVLNLELKALFDQFVYEIHFSNDTSALVDAVNGALLSPISKEFSREIALASFSGPEPILSIQWIEDQVIEYRGKYPVWRIDFDNLEQTSFFVSPETGQLVAKRGVLWRVYDFMWMLHIMDYDKRKNFNHWWLIGLALLGMILSISGLVLVRYSFRKRDFTQFFK